MDDIEAAVLLTTDELLAADVLRLGAAAGVEIVVHRSTEEALPAWPTAAAVLVGSDLAADAARLRLASRTRVYVVGRHLPEDVFRTAVGCGAEEVVRLPEDEEALVRLLADVVDGAGGATLVVGVLGGAGGVGASTFAVALALRSAQRSATVLIDADVSGVGVDQIIGLGSGDGVRWDALLAGTGRLSGRSLRDALPRRDGLAVLAWPVERGPVPDLDPAREVLAAAPRGFATVVIDLPRHGSAWTADLVARCDRVVVVSTTTVPSVAATARVLPGLGRSRPGVVLRRRAGGLEPREVGRFLRLPVVTTMSGQRRLDEDIALGVGPFRRTRGPLARAAEETLGWCREARRRAA